MQKIWPTGEPEGLRWGCAFCSTGAEGVVAQRLCQLDGIWEAFSVRQMQHKSIQGQRSEIMKVMLPGYVFFRAVPEIEMYRVYRVDKLLRLLTYDDGSWTLRGGDLEFAEWMRAHDGILGVSHVYREGEKIVIASGPLKELEGVIKKVDRHNRNGLVSILFGGKETKVWLPFEYITEERE